MTVALWDVIHTRDLLKSEIVKDLSNSSLVQLQLAKLHWRRKNLSSVINILAQALYELFAAGDGKVFSIFAYIWL